MRFPHVQSPHDRSRLVAGGIIALVSIATLVFTFLLGQAVGHVKAEFSCRFRERAAPSAGDATREGRMPGFFEAWMPFRGPASLDAHGVVGPVTTIEGGMLTVQGADATKTVVLSDDTEIRRGRTSVASSALAVGDQVSVIGAPDAEGRIAARIIMVFPTPAAAPSR